MNDNDDLEMIAYNNIELIMTNPLTDMECQRLLEGLERYGIDGCVNRQGRILTFDVMDANEDMRTIVGEMADMGLVEDIGLLKMVTTLEPQWEKEKEDGIYH